MLLFAELALYAVLSITLIGMAMQRPIWGVGYYMLNYFAQPAYWSWGEPLNAAFSRWSLLSGFILLASVMVHQSRLRFRHDDAHRSVGTVLILLLVNATIVHFGWAYHAALAESYEKLIEIAKFVVLYFLIVTAVQSRADFIRLIWFFALGLGYWGFEAKFIGVTLIAGRLEKFGGPGCANSNELASITAGLIPLVGGLLFLVKGNMRLVVVAIAMLGTNILMLCNSRGGFLSLIGVALSLPFLAPGKARKYALNGLGAGAIGVFLLAGNPEILARFTTILHSEEEASVSGKTAMDYKNKQTRLAFWMAGIDLIKERPIGNGGGAFAGELGNIYLTRREIPDANRSVHQGYIGTAVSWGVQGLILRMLFVVFGVMCAVKTAKFRAKIGDPSIAFFGACAIGGIIGWLISCLFGEVLHLEWGYWLVIVCRSYTKIFCESNYGVVPDAMVTGMGRTNQVPGSYQQLAAAGV